MADDVQKTILQSSERFNLERDIKKLVAENDKLRKENREMREGYSKINKMVTSAVNFLMKDDNKRTGETYFQPGMDKLQKIQVMLAKLLNR